MWMVALWNEPPYSVLFPHYNGITIIHKIALNSELIYDFNYQTVFSVSCLEYKQTSSWKMQFAVVRYTQK